MSSAELAPQHAAAHCLQQTNTRMYRTGSSSCSRCHCQLTAPLHMPLTTVLATQRWQHKLAWCLYAPEIDPLTAVKMQESRTPLQSA